VTRKRSNLMKGTQRGEEKKMGPSASGIRPFNERKCKREYVVRVERSRKREKVSSGAVLQSYLMPGGKR